ncbi:unnamed protein product [Schistosoma margrebowiei]|uniref:Uncharacterized protein n=1 Tax=Schistosoma margrebowiei TaxID=48269 RepID=A0A183LGD9_9TREM|nr:unnamed protein product [Schistosoma margrebowiei]
MKKSTSEGKHGLKWAAQKQLDDLDFADNLALLWHTHGQMQMKTTNLTAISAAVGISMHSGKSKILKYNTQNTNPVTFDGETLEEVESFTCLGSIDDEQGRSDAYEKERISKARSTFL